MPGRFTQAMLKWRLNVVVVWQQHSALPAIERTLTSASPRVRALWCTRFGAILARWFLSCSHGGRRR